MDSLDTSNNQVIFKKRNHRPWETSSLEDALESSLMPALEESREESREQLRKSRTDDLDQFSPGEYRHSREFKEEFSRALREDILRDDINREEYQSHSPNKDFNAMNSHYLERELQKALGAKAKERFEASEMIREDENRIMIGGFLQANKIFSVDDERREQTHYLMDEITHKDDEIQMLAKILKAAKASEQVEKLEGHRQREEDARKTAEEKAMIALRQAKLANEQARKAEQRAQMEQVFRAGEEGSRKLLEEKLKTAMYALKSKEEALQKEEQARKEAENKIQEVLQYASGAEQKIKGDADRKIREVLQQASEHEVKIRREAEDQVKEILQITMKSENKLQRESEERMKILEEKLEAKALDIESKAQKIAFEKIRSVEELAESNLKEHLEKANRGAYERIRVTEEQADARIKEAEDRSTYLIKEMELRTQDRITEIKLLAERQVFEAHEAANQKLKNIQKELVAFEKVKEAAVLAEQKLFEEARKSDIAKLDMETKFEVAIQKHIEEKSEYERKIEILNQQQALTQEKKIVAENDAVLNANQLSAALENLQKLESVIQTERNLRKVLEHKFLELQVKGNDEVKKATEDRMNELLQRVDDMTRIQSKFEKKHKKEKKKNTVEEVATSEVMSDPLEAIADEWDKLQVPKASFVSRGMSAITSRLKGKFSLSFMKKKKEKLETAIAELPIDDILTTAPMETREFSGF